MPAKSDIIWTGFVGFTESIFSGIFMIVPLYLLNERYHLDHHDLDAALPKYQTYFIWYTLYSLGFWVFVLFGVLKEIRPLLIPWLMFQIAALLIDLIKNVFLLFECFIQIHLFVEWSSEFSVLIIVTILSPLYMIVRGKLWLHYHRFFDKNERDEYMLVPTVSS